MIDKNKQRSKFWIWIILGIILLIGGGITIYYLTKNEETKSTSQTLPNQEIQEFKSQVEQIKDHLGNLDQNIQQDNSQLQQKQAKLTQAQEQNKAQEATKLKQQIQGLEAKLTKTRKQKEYAEKAIFQLEKEINSLTQGQAKQEAIRKIEAKINKLTQKLEIKLVTVKPRTERKKPPVPNPSATKSNSDPTSDESSPSSVENSTNNSSDQNNPNLQTFQTLRKQSQGLTTLLEKIIQDYGKRVKDFNTASQQAKEQGIDMEAGEIGEIIKGIKQYLETAKSNKTTLEGYVSEKDYQTFLKASPETQKINIELVQDAIKHAIKSTQENLSYCLDSVQKMLKAVEEMLESVGENGSNNEEIQSAKKEMQEGKKFLNDCQTKLNGLKELDINEQIKVLGEVWDKIQEFEEKNRND